MNFLSRNELVFGADGENNGQFNGYIDDINIYNYILEESEIKKSLFEYKIRGNDI